MKNVKESTTSKNLNLSLSEKKEALKLKFKKSLGNKELSLEGNSSIYKYASTIKGDKDKEKKVRGSIRRYLNKAYKQIVLSGANNNDLFLHLDILANHYKENYILNNFKIESFTNQKGDNKKKMSALLEALKNYVELSK